jgi:hypothetical protein
MGQIKDDELKMKTNLTERQYFIGCTPNPGRLIGRKKDSLSPDTVKKKGKNHF